MIKAEEYYQELEQCMADLFHAIDGYEWEDTRQIFPRLRKYVDLLESECEDNLAIKDQLDEYEV